MIAAFPDVEGLENVFIPAITGMGDANLIQSQHTGKWKQDFKKI